MQIREVMTSPVATITPHATLLEAAHEMRERRTQALLVAEGEKPRGVVTESDITYHVLQDDNNRIPSRRVEEIMSPKTAACFEDAEIEVVQTFMEQIGFARLIVFNREHKPVGLAQTEDLPAQ